MITETSAVAFRQNLGEMLNLVQYRNDAVLIKKDGKPVAALIDARLFERIRRMQDRFDALCDRLGQSYDGAPEGVASAEIEQAADLARQETAADWRATGRLPGGAAVAKSKAASPSKVVGKRSKAKAMAPAKR